MPNLTFPGFAWVDTAVGGADRRNHLRDVTRWHPRHGSVDCFRTWGRYPDAMRRHFGEHRDASHPRGTVTGYAGPLYGDSLPIDVDRPDPAEALDATRTILYRLRARYELPLEAARVYFSGAKGFHVMLPSVLFGAEPGPALHRVFAAMAATLLHGIHYDAGIYDRTRLWRCPNTVNSKSGLHKVPLTPAEVLHLDIGGIQAVAGRPRTSRRVPAEPCPALREVYDAAAAGVAHDHADGCVARRVGADEWAALLAADHPPGDRHPTLVRLVGHWLALGMEEPEALALAALFNRSRCCPPKPEGEVAALVADVFRRYGPATATEPEAVAAWLALSPRVRRELVSGDARARRRATLAAAREGVPTAVLARLVQSAPPGVARICDPGGLAAWATRIAALEGGDA